MAAACASLLFAYFYNGQEELLYALSTDGLKWDALNGGWPVLNASISTLRDPFINRGPDGLFHMVATNGASFGGTHSILTWSSADLIAWSRETVVTVMPPDLNVSNVWAPEWRYSPLHGQYMVFWAARGQGLLPPIPSSNCSGNSSYRFAFFKSWTADFISFTPPDLLFDPGCDFTGAGGIDGDLVQDESGAYVLVYKDARGTGSGHSAEIFRGIRLLKSASIDSGYVDADVSQLLVPTLVEGPELVQLPGGAPGWHLYFDCTFWPTPPGYPRPPYGVAYTPSLVNYNFTTLEGSCTGNNSALMSFPPGATHGSFVCLNQTEAAAIAAAFP